MKTQLQVQCDNILVSTQVFEIIVVRIKTNQFQNANNLVNFRWNKMGHELLVTEFGINKYYNCFM